MDWPISILRWANPVYAYELRRQLIFYVIAGFGMADHSRTCSALNLNYIQSSNKYRRIIIWVVFFLQVVAKPTFIGCFSDSGLYEQFGVNIPNDFTY